MTDLYPGILEAYQDWGFKLGVNGPMGLMETAGWRTRRAAETCSPEVAVNHHTAGSPTGLLPSLNVLIFGRSGVPGPLCNDALARNACLWMVAAGRSNNAGSGGWNGYTGNSRTWGLEVEHIGLATEPVTDQQWEAMWRRHRAASEFFGFPIGNVCQHFEWAPTRKIDFVKSITNPHAFRQNVAGVIKPGIPPIKPKDDKMYVGIQHPNPDLAWWSDFMDKREVTLEEMGILAYVIRLAGGTVLLTNDNKPQPWSQYMIDSLALAKPTQLLDFVADPDGGGPWLVALSSLRWQIGNDAQALQDHQNHWAARGYDVTVKTWDREDLLTIPMVNAPTQEPPPDEPPTPQ
jgi:hypothetical protein